jgi:O-acetyl-ADP-ribose deacetylase (regulator of RNase III)
MIHYVSGDILLSRAQALAHGVAPNDDFKQGLALALRERWPGMYGDFRHYFHAFHPKTGEVWTWGGVGGVRLISLYTQELAGGHGPHPGVAKLEYVNHALRELRREIERQGFTSVALPRLATGVGRLNWDDVKPLIEHHLGGLNIPVYVYETYQPGVTADEPEVAQREPVAA